MARQPTKPITVRFDERTRQQLLALAEKQNTNTAEVIRRLVMECLELSNFDRRIGEAAGPFLAHTEERILENVSQGVEQALRRFAAFYAQRMSG